MGSQQRDIIIGTLLGDGLLEKNGRGWRLVIDHSSNQAKYVSWIKDKLVQYEPKIMHKDRYDHRTQKIYRHCILRTISTKEFKDIYNLLYRNGKKVIPHNFAKILSPQMLAVWIMDDGYKRKDCNAMRLNTQSFQYHDHVIIQEALKTLGIRSTIQKHKTAFVIYIKSESMHQLRTIVRDLICDSMIYKIA